MPTAWWQPAEAYVSPCDVHRVVGARLHALRLEAEMSVRTLQQLSGVHRARIRYYECGGIVTLPILARLAHALGFEVLDLVWDLRFPPPPARWRRPRTNHACTSAVSRRAPESAPYQSPTRALPRAPPAPPTTGACRSSTCATS